MNHELYGEQENTQEEGTHPAAQMKQMHKASCVDSNDECQE
jgi:hypothetical protein